MDFIDKRLPVYAETEKRIGWRDIGLVRDGDYAVVMIEHEGRRIEIIRELLDGNFSHWISALGIEDAILKREEFSSTSRS
jgi:hypothetical protein